ncbi:MAG: substrate-binding domain-containing protein, partial [Caulobacterales bacterium]|nr:substrate-binding domain-containing protein [Caulobacterales bacterium]
FARRARLMEMEYRHALAEIEAAQRGASGALRIGGGPGWVESILPPAITTFQRQHPNVKFDLDSGVIDTLIPKLLSGDLDLVCSSLDFANHPELVKEHLVDMQHAVFARADHPLATKDAVTPGDLIGYPWVAPLGDHVGRNRLESFFAAHELDPPEIRTEVAAGFSTLLKFAVHGDCLLSAPRTMRREAEDMGLAVILRESRLWETPAGIAFRYTEKPRPLLNAFIALMRSEFETYARREDAS